MLTLYSFHLPLLALFIVGIALSAQNLKTQPKRAAYPLVAFIILFLHELVTPYLWAKLPLFLMEHSPTTMGFYMILTRIVVSVVELVAWTLILLALFRQPKSLA